jgi:transketolase
MQPAKGAVAFSPQSNSIRKTILEIISNSQASHIGSCFSIVEILSAVYRCVDIEKIRTHQEDRDRVVLSKGHSAAALYSVLYHFGLIEEREIKTYCSKGSLYSGHASHFLPYVEHSTGALGHGLSVAVGIGIGLKSKKISSKVYVIVGDGELNEGSNWEAFMLAGHKKLNNLFVLIDNNKFGGIGKTDYCCSLEPLDKKLESFGFETYRINGHDEELIISILQKRNSEERETPIAIVCDTIKGKGVSFMENNNVWHYRPPVGDDYEKALEELGRSLK